LGLAVAAFFPAPSILPAAALIGVALAAISAALARSLVARTFAGALAALALALAAFGRTIHFLGALFLGSSLIRPFLLDLRASGLAFSAGLRLSALSSALRPAHLGLRLSCLAERPALARVLLLALYRSGDGGGLVR